MNAQQLLIISATSRAVYHFAHFFEAAIDNIDSLQEELSKLDKNKVDLEQADNEADLEKANYELYEVYNQVEKAASILRNIVKPSINDKDFFDSLSLEDEIFLDERWGRLYDSDYPLFSSEWVDEHMLTALKSEADQVRVRAIYQRGLDWFEAHLHSVSSAK
jgi:hypothetical protein